MSVISNCYDSFFGDRSRCYFSKEDELANAAVGMEAVLNQR